jgi:hypothetical protein
LFWDSLRLLISDFGLSLELIGAALAPLQAFCFSKMAPVACCGDE